MSHPKLKQQDLKTLKEMGVEAVYLFGSRAQAKDHPLSDYDYAALLKKKGHSKGDDIYFKLYDLFCAISPRTLQNDVIDIVFLRDAGLELRFHVIRYGKVLYDGNPKARLQFEEQTVLLYCDFKPLLEEQDRTILQSL